MIAYLDTHIAIRLAHGNLRIGRDAARLIKSVDLLVSPMVLVELEYLYEINRLTVSGQDILRKLQIEIGLRLCDLPFADVAKAALDEKWTRDVFDRMIVAQAKVNGLAPLISSDEIIADHYPRTVW
ncbi:MAG TPA: PIN domain-containing protein [Terracidiphilus sp.]|jgi:PIN domain nuclease of toxin-antitoxin system